MKYVKLRHQLADRHQSPSHQNRQVPHPYTLPLVPLGNSNLSPYQARSRSRPHTSHQLLAVYSFVLAQQPLDLFEIELIKFSASYNWCLWNQKIPEAKCLEVRSVRTCELIN